MIKVWDIVVLKNANTAIILWKVRKVEELLRSSDGVVTSTKVLVLNSDNRKRTFAKTIYLIPLEVRAETEADNMVKIVTKEEPVAGKDSGNKRSDSR